MKPTSSKDFLENISYHFNAQRTYYKFNKRNLIVAEKYRSGRLAAYEYVGELCFYFMQEEKRIPDQFREQIKGQIRKNSCLKDGEYKQGLFDALNEILDECQKDTRG